MKNRLSRENDDTPMITLSVAAFSTLLISSFALLSGDMLTAFGVIYASVTLFAVAFVSAPLFSRLRLNWATRAATLSLILGWIFSAPLGFLINIAMNYIGDIEPLFEFVPETWLWALVPLVISLVVTSIRQIIFTRDSR